MATEQQYTALEEKVRAGLVAHMGDFLNEQTCQIADLDKTIAAMKEQDKVFGCVIDFGGMKPTRPETFASTKRTWSLPGLFFVSYTPDNVEFALRRVIDRLASAFRDDPRLGNTVDLAKVTEIDLPEIVHVNDVPMYWLPFIVEVMTQ